MKSVRVGAGQGFYGDTLTGALAVAERGDVRYLCRDALAELTMAILARQRYEVPGLLALNFVLHGALDGGGAHSLRSDPLGKSFGSLLLRMFVELDIE